MAGRGLPALHGVAGELPGLEAAAVEVEREVLGHRAIAVALGLGARGGFAPVCLVGELAALCQVVGEGACGSGERLVRRQRTELVLLAERVRHLDDGDLGLRQVGEGDHGGVWLENRPEHAGCERSLSESCEGSCDLGFARELAAPDLGQSFVDGLKRIRFRSIGVRPRRSKQAGSLPLHPAEPPASSAPWPGAFSIKLVIGSPVSSSWSSFWSVQLASRPSINLSHAFYTSSEMEKSLWPYGCSPRSFSTSRIVKLSISGNLGCRTLEVRGGSR